MYTAYLFLFKPFVWWRSRYRRLRNLLKLLNSNFNAPLSHRSGNLSSIRHFWVLVDRNPFRISAEAKKTFSDASIKFPQPKTYWQKWVMESCWRQNVYMTILWEYGAKSNINNAKIWFSTEFVEWLQSSPFITSLLGTLQAFERQREGKQKW